MSRRQIAFGVLIFILLIFLGLGGYYYYGTLSTSSGSYSGCYKDDVNRVLPKKHGLMTWNECRAKAQQAGDSYFGLQYAEDTLAKPGQAQCFSGSGNYSLLGATTSCSAKDSSGRTLGAAWSNAVYKT